jgi:hypothetical protein
MLDKIGANAIDELLRPGADSALESGSWEATFLLPRFGPFIVERADRQPNDEAPEMAVEKVAPFRLSDYGVFGQDADAESGPIEHGL